MNTEKLLLQLVSAGAAPEQAQRLLSYGARLLAWNEKMNLTGAKDLDELTQKHLLDSVLAWKVRNTAMAGALIFDQIVDVGSGGGIPGIPLAILQDKPVVLVERRQKKARALEELAIECELGPRVGVRAESLEKLCFSTRSEFWFRGVLPADKLISYFSREIPSRALSQVVLMKGPAWGEELRRALEQPDMDHLWCQRFEQAEVFGYELPDGAGTRNLVLL